MALRTRGTVSEKEWKEHLNSIGIPDPYAEEYAATFCKHQIPKHFITRIPDNELRDTYEIELGGHRLLILLSGESTAATPSTLMNTQQSKPNVRHQSPQLQPSMTPSSFRAFVSHWTMYKRLVGISSNGVDSAAQIFFTCMYGSSRNTPNYR